METGGFRCREKQITDLTIGGEDFGFIILMLMEEEVMIQKQSRQILGDGKLSDIIGWKKLTTIEVSMLLPSGTRVKNLSIFSATPETEAEFV